MKPSFAMVDEGRLCLRHDGSVCDRL